jgi:tripartite-type tricarboxylate transporter receptor subunit TctC
MHGTHILKGLACLGLGLGALSSGAAAQGVEAFYKDKMVDMIVGSDAATEYTRDARLVSQYLTRHIPGNPRIIVKNMPGASSIKAANYLYQIAAKDGSVLGVFNKAIPMAEATKLQGVAYKSAEFNWLGSMSRTNSLVVTWKTSGVETLEDARKREITIGAQGLSGTMAAYPFLLNSSQGTRFKVVAGYQGSAAVNLAMERGEVEGRGTYSWDFFKSDNQDWKTNKKMNFLVQIGLEKEPDLPDVPLLIDLATDETQRAVYRLLSADSMIARPFLTTPGVPAERVAALRAAFDKAMVDPDFLRDAAKSHSDVNPVSGARVEEIVKDMVGTPPAVVEQANQWMSPPR